MMLSGRIEVGDEGGGEIDVDEVREGENPLENIC